MNNIQFEINYESRDNDKGTTIVVYRRGKTPYTFKYTWKRVKWIINAHQSQFKTVGYGSVFVTPYCYEFHTSMLLCF